MRAPSGWWLIRDPNRRLTRFSTSASQALSAALAWCSRMFLACMGTMRKAASVPVSAVRDAK
jgi:hypothetical protein